MSRWEKVLFIIACAVCALIVLFAVFAAYKAQPGSTIEVNGEAIDLRQADTVKIESTRDVMVWEHSTETVTTITVTVWMKP